MKYEWPKNEFGENELERILYLGIPESTANYEALRRGATKAIKKLMLDLIGPDEPETSEESSYYQYHPIQYDAIHRNELRADLRAKVEEL